MTFAVDGAVVRTLNYEDANGGSNFPQTPMRLKLGSWAAGAKGNAAGTIEWAGGATDFSQAPFTMYVKSVKVDNYNPATSYKWTDKTGSYKSIKLIKDDGSSTSAGQGRQDLKPPAHELHRRLRWSGRERRPGSAGRDTSAPYQRGAKP